MTDLGEDRVYLSIGSAVSDFQRRWPSDGEAATSAEPGSAGPGGLP